MRLNNISDGLNPLSSFANLSLSTPHRVLIVGCAYGGISAVVNLLDYSHGKARTPVYPGPDFKGLKSKKGIEITVIDERDGYFHSVGAPLAHVAPKHTNLMWKRFSHLNELKHPNLHFKHGSVKNIDPASKVAEWQDRTGKTQHQAYDYLIMATGLRRHWPAVPRHGSYDEYLKDGKQFISKIVGGDPEKPQDGRKIVIIGAGAVGIEFAGEIKNYYPNIAVTLVHSRDQVLSSEPLPDEVKDRAKTLLEEEGVDLVLGNRASIADLPDGKFEVTLANGTKITADFVIDSTKKGWPTTETLPAEALNADKEILVHNNLMFKSPIPNAESHFGVGDVIEWTGIKRAGSAMVMGQAAAQNIFASILNSEKSEEEEKFSFCDLPSWAAVIGIAIGKQCLTYDPGNGVKWGVEVMKGYFGDDLGWAANLRYVGLTDVEEKKKEAISQEPENVRISEVGVEPVSAAA
ncbi:FAD/NAD(P)-binding domain-containing protein [Corynespora cassiicola Philippines]|uniref:FAD/NAD(P)-binding domain-containing protein n=1 Tax=Corynespora cassiicola Philippines TaxID=1448308 RepID=A0A2T2P8Q4_CORCC|nr:FAD/NAD(P)-binding domain-containing protein [Corynespora cassiicola Philippines]